MADPGFVKRGVGRESKFRARPEKVDQWGGGGGGGGGLRHFYLFYFLAVIYIIG